MLYRPSDLDPERQSAFEEHAESVRRRTLEEIERTLEGLDPALAQFCYEVGFRPNESLPQRDQRPQLRPAVLALATADAHGLDEPAADALLGFTAASQEYFDVLDDVVDGDVAGGSEGEALLGAQLLLALAVDRLSVLGAGAVAHWADSVGRLVAAPLTEAREEPSAERYDEVLERQSELLGSVTGCCAVAAGADDEAVAHAARVGRLVYRHFAIVHDVEQHAAGEDADDDWTAPAVFGRDGVRERLAELRTDVEAATERYPDPAARRIRNLVALDVEKWERVLDGA